MTADSAERSILGRGETLIEAAVKKQRGFPKPLPRTYAEARHRFLLRLESLAAEAGALADALRHPGETFLALRLHPDFSAAAFEPDRLLALLPAAAKAGARPWRAPLAEVAPTAQVSRELERGEAAAFSRLLFLAVDPERFFGEARRFLDRAESSLPQAVRHDLQRIERIDFLRPEERVPPGHFPEGWDAAPFPRAELILHPSSLPLEARRDHLLRRLGERGAGIDPARARFRVYPGAPTFVSLPLGPAGIELLRDYNPLRTARLLAMNPLPVLRSAPTLAAPRPPLPGPPAPVRIAVFDGGLDPSLPLLGRRAVPDAGEASRLPPHPDCVAHGTAVAGAILHGPLNPYAARDVLPPPPVSVLAHRVFPLTDPADLDLYEAIDAVERAVPRLRREEGVRIVNLSFGPRGPIGDDAISRFTYVLDRLAYDWDLLPVVAVGNDGEAPPPFGGRIQAPADAVNALSVGAFSEYGGGRYPVPYSCRGPGREGAKGKPDLAAFGGCERTPIHLVAAEPGLRVLDHGTSFAAPLAARLCGELLGLSPGLSPLLLRALLVHHSAHPGAGFDYALGHGFLPASARELLDCPPKTVSILFDHALDPKSVVRMPIPFPAGVAKGKAEISWTIAVLAPVDPRSSLEYTGAAVAATFYPNAGAYHFTPPSFLAPKPPPRKVNVALHPAEAAELAATGWTRSELPVSKSANVYRHEAGLRGGDLKWDALVRASTSMRAEGLSAPFLLLQALARRGEKRPVRFAGVITLRLPGMEGDVYDEVVRAYPSLRKMDGGGREAVAAAG